MLRSLSSAVLVAAVALPLQAQRADFNWSKAVGAGSTVSIHNINGNIKVVPSTSGKVEVLGYRRGSGSAADHLKVEVNESSRGVNICVVMDDGDNTCDDNGYHSNDRGGWFGNRHNRNWDDAEMRLEVAVPANLTVRPSTVSGDISIDGAHGDISASSVSGDIEIDHVHAASMRLNTVSGDIKAYVDELTGNGDFSFHSVSGDLTLTVPRAFSADLSMTTVSGDIDSDFPITLGNGRMSRRSMNARIGSGGRRLDVSTVSGDLKLRMGK